MNEFYTLSEIAKTLHKSRVSIYRIIKKNRLIPYYRKTHPSSPLYKKCDIDLLYIPSKYGRVNNSKLHKNARDRDNNKCKICFRNDTIIHAHHIIPIEIGGKDSMENLISLCKGCHSSLHQKGLALINKSKRHGTLAIATWLINCLKG